MKNMNRIVGLFLIIAIMASTALPVSAVSTPAESLPLQPGEVTFPDTVTRAHSEDIYATAEGYSYVTEYYVVQGKTELHIDSCTWNPANDISIGFYANDASGIYGVNYSGGSIANRTITTEYVPSGQYWVYVYNKGPGTITGAISYYLSD